MRWRSTHGTAWELGRYYFIASVGQEHQFLDGQVCHLMQPDINHEIRGLPE